MMEPRNWPEITIYTQDDGTKVGRVVMRCPHGDQFDIPLKASSVELNSEHSANFVMATVTLYAKVKIQ